jgi:hypothetical protein
MEFGKILENILENPTTVLPREIISSSRVINGNPFLITLKTILGYCLM